MSVEIKMLKYGVWNIMGEHKTMEEGEIYKVPARCAKEICDSGQGEYTGKDKPAPEENKAIEPEENKAKGAAEKEKADVEYTEDGEEVAKTYDDNSPEAEAERQEIAARTGKLEYTKEKVKPAAKKKGKKGKKSSKK